MLWMCIESPRQGDSYTHPRHMIYRDFMTIEIKNTGLK